MPEEHVDLANAIRMAERRTMPDAFICCRGRQRRSQCLFCGALLYTGNDLIVCPGCRAGEPAARLEWADRQLAQLQTR